MNQQENKSGEENMKQDFTIPNGFTLGNPEAYEPALNEHGYLEKSVGGAYFETYQAASDSIERGCLPQAWFPGQLLPARVYALFGAEHDGIVDKVGATKLTSSCLVSRYESEATKSGYERRKIALARRRLEFLANAHSLQQCEFLSLEAFAAVFFISYDRVCIDVRLKKFRKYLSGKPYIDVEKWKRVQRFNSLIPIETEPEPHEKEDTDLTDDKQAAGDFISDQVE